MNSRRFSVRFNLNYSDEKAAWEFLHRDEGKSINKLVIDAVNFYEQNHNLPQMLRLMAEQIQSSAVHASQMVMTEEDQQVNESTVFDFLDNM